MVVRIHGRVREGRLELDGPVRLPDGVDVEVVIHISGRAEADGWTEAGIARLEEEWDNPEDAIYDDWRTLYGV